MLNLVFWHLVASWILFTGFLAFNGLPEIQKLNITGFNNENWKPIIQEIQNLINPESGKLKIREESQGLTTC